jgi:hypothetical protein
MAIEFFDTNKQDRRVFLAQLGAVAGGVALLSLPGCDDPVTAGVVEGEHDLEMHGPVEMALEELERPLEPSAMALFAPYDDGTPFSDRWAVGHAIRGKRDQVCVVLVDTETGGHAVFDIYRLEPSIRPIAASELYGFYLDNDGRGDVKTPQHLERLAARLAEIVSATESVVTVAWAVPTMSAARAKRQAEIQAMGQAPAVSADGPQTMAEALLLVE